MAGSIGQLDPTTTVTPGTEEARGFDFFFEEEETPAKSDDEDWEDWEDEEDPYIHASGSLDYMILLRMVSCEARHSFR